MDAKMREENARLRSQLHTLLAQARENERKLTRLQAEQLRLLEVDTLSDLLDELLINYANESDLSGITLALLDPNHEIERMIDEAEYPMPANLLLLRDIVRLQQYYGVTPAIEMGEYIAEVHRDWFCRLEPAPASVALLPLTRRGRLLGSLNLASADADRFRREYSSNFIEGLASATAISLENILNRGRLQRIGLTDTLTGLNNRRFFDQRLNEELMRALRNERPLSVLFIDIDEFKSINDRHGHVVGDHVLMELSRHLRRQMRMQDVLARFGGEEFAALLIGDGIDAARRAAERIRAAIEQAAMPIPANGGGVTVSIGVTDLSAIAAAPTAAGEPVEQLGRKLLDAADRALYAAKHAGRNRVGSTGPAESVPPAEQRVPDR